MLLRLLFLFVLAPVPFPLPSQAAPLPLPKIGDLIYPNRIRVRLEEAASKVEVGGMQLRLREPGRSNQLLLQAEAWTIRCQNGRIRAIPTQSPFQNSDALDLVEPVIIQSVSGRISLGGKPYRGELQIHSIGSFCEVVNHLEIERYLTGLVNAEFNSKWNEEATGAQIVAARTYALHQIKIARADPDRRFDVDATVSDQVYDGTMREDLQAQRLVEKTRGMVLTVGKSWHPTPLKAFYHSTCGGMTELPEKVWGTTFPGFRRVVRCPYCGGSPAIHWQLDLSSKDVVEAFRRASVSSEGSQPEWARSWPSNWRQVIAGRNLTGMRTGPLDADGRVSEITTIWSNVELKVSGARFRDWIGPAKLRSTSFRVLSQVLAHGKGNWLIQGRGNGHGVGMCQWGAKTMGERGFKTASILKYYYPDAILRKLW